MPHTVLKKSPTSAFYARPIGLTEPRKAGVKRQPNGLRYLRWGGDGEAVRPEKR